MKIQKLKGLAFDKESGVIGVIVSVDHVKGKVVVATENGEDVLDVDNVEYLAEVGELNGEPIFNRDVFAFTQETIDAGNVVEGKEDSLFELELLENGKLLFHSLDVVEGEFVRKEKGAEFDSESLALLGDTLEVLGNIHQLAIEIEEEETVDFNIAIVRHDNGDNIEYLYACNNKEKEEVDLIKVVFVGAKLLEEEYSRQTVSHEEYLLLVEHGELKEVSPQELQNYVTGLMYGSTSANDNDEVEDIYEESEDFDDEEDEDEDFDANCPDCGGDFFDCEC